MRLFVGVPIPEEIKTKLVEVQQELGKTGADLKLVGPENLHFTIKFLGEVPPNKVEFIKGALSETVSEHSRFTVRVSSLGVFPSEKFVRVVWVGVSEGSEPFADLIRDVQEKLSSVRKEEYKEIQVHLTVARVRSAKNIERLMNVVTRLKDVDIGSVMVERVVLYQSVLGPKGPTYSIVKEYPLGSAKAL